MLWETLEDHQEREEEAKESITAGSVGESAALVFYSEAVIEEKDLAKVEECTGLPANLNFYTGGRGGIRLECKSAGWSGLPNSFTWGFSLWNISHSME